MLSCKNNVAATDGLFSTYYVFSKLIFDDLKAYNQIYPKSDIKNTLM